MNTSIRFFFFNKLFFKPCLALLLFIGFIPMTGVFSQSIDPWVISTQGKSDKTQTLQLDWVIGEPVMQYNAAGGLMLTQGFLQTEGFTVNLSSNSPVCNGGTLQLSADSLDGASYAWTGPNGFSANTRLPLRNTLLPTDTGYYYLAVSYQSQQIAFDSIQVSILAPSLNLTPSHSGTVIICSGDTTTLSVSGANTYLWSNGATTASLQVSTAGTWSVTGRDGNGCYTNASVFTSTIQSPPAVLINPTGPLTLCIGDSVLLRASGAVNYVWNNNQSGDSIWVYNAGTFSVTGTDQFGCSAISSNSLVSIQTAPVITVQVIGSTQLCQGDSVTMLAQGAQSYIWNTSHTGASLLVSSVGSYQVTGTSQNGCTASSSIINVSVNPLPVVTIQSSGPTSFCLGGSVVLNAQGASSYLWSNGQTSSSITVNTSGAYTVTGISSLGCSSVSQPLNVNVHLLPIVSIVPLGPVTFCQGGSVQLVATGGHSYQWSTGSNQPVIQVNTSGTFTVTGVDQNGCSIQTNPLTVTVNALPVIQINPSGPLSFCSGGQVTLQATGGQSYLWSNGSAQQAITVQTADTYSVTGTDSNGCQSQSSVLTVSSINPHLRIDSTGPLTFCQGSSVILTAGGGSNYVWSDGQTTNTILVISSGTYSLTGIDSSGCGNGVASVVVRVNPLPNVGLVSSGPLNICPNDSVQLTGTGPNMFYIWNTGAFSQNITVRTAGTYRVTGIDINGCVNTSVDSIVSILPAPVVQVNANGPLRFCQGGDVILNASGAASYLWSNGQTTNSIQVSTNGTYYVVGSNSFGCPGRSGDNIVIVDTLPIVAITPLGNPLICAGDTLILQASGASSYLWSNGSTQPSINVVNTGTFFVTGTNSFGCASISASQTVITKPLPVVTISPAGPLSLCQGGSVALQASGASSYVWSNGSTGDSLLVAVSGSYGVTGTSVNGCSASATPVQVTVLPLPQVTLSPAGTIAVCQGDSVILRASGASLYNWSNSHVGDSLIVRASGTFSVTGFDANGCSQVSGVTRVMIVPLPSPQISHSTPLSFCQGDSVILSVNGTDNYLWSTGSTQSSIVVYNTGLYSVTATNNFGCSRNAVPANVQVNPLPQISVSPSGPLRFCQGGNVSLTASGASSYLWSTGNTQPIETVTTSGTYQVDAWSSFGCQASSSLFTVTVDTLPLILTQPSGNIQICAGGQIAVQAQGATAYLWSNGLNTQSVSLSNAGTYTVSGTDNNGCVGVSAPVQLSLYSNFISIQPSGPLDFCSGDHVVLSASVPGTYIWSNSQVGQSITVSNSGTYSVSGTDQNGCQVSAPPVTVHVRPLPVVTVSAAGATTFCQGGSVVLNASGASSYVWSSGQTSPSIQVTQPGAYRVLGFSSFGCQDSSNVIGITVNPTPPIPLITGNQTISRGQTATLFASGSSGTYTWWTSSVGGTAIGTGAQFTSGPINTFTYFYVDATLNGCASARDSFLIVFPEAVLSNSPVCSGLPIYFDVSPLLPQGTVLWTGPNGFSSTLRNPGIAQPQTSASGTYIIQISQGNQVVFTDSVQVVVGQNLTQIAVTGNSPVCHQATLQVSVPQYNGTTYAWAGPQGFTSNQNSFSITSVTGVDAGRYTLTAASPGCNAVNRVYDVNVVGGLPLQLASNAPICSGSALFLTAQNPGGGVSPVWRGPNNYQASGLSVSRANVTAAMSGIYSFSISVPGCPMQTDTLMVHIQTPPSSLPSTVTSVVCAGDSIVLSATIQTGVQYVWTGPAGFSSQQPLNTIYNVGQVHSGRYYLSMSVPECPAVTRSHNVLVNGWGNLSPGSNSPVCTGSVLYLTAQNPGGATSYAWSGPANFVSSVLNPSISNVTTQRSGQYTLTANIPGCPPRTDFVNVIINAAISNARAGANTPVCEGNTLFLTSTHYPNAVYAWTGPAGFTANVSNPTITGVQTNQSGNYIVSISNPGCSGRTVSVPVQVNPMPQPNGGSNSPVCQGSVLWLTASQNNGASYNWVYPNGYSTTSLNPLRARTNALVNMSGVYTLTVTVPGCGPLIQMVPVSVSGRISGIQVGANQNQICRNATLVLTGTQVAGASLTWTGPESFSATGATASRTLVQPNHSGVYTYSVLSPGCGSTTRTLSITVNTTDGLGAGILHNPVCQGQPVYFLGFGPPNIQYSWQGPAGFASSIQNPSRNQIQLFHAGWYSVTATVPGCPQTTATVELIVNSCRQADTMSQAQSQTHTLPEPTDGITSDRRITLLLNPNPTDAWVNASLSEPLQDKSHLKVYDLLGHEVLVNGGKLSDTEWRLNLSDLAKGVYWIEVSGGDMVLRERLIIQ